jgi:hypothetical protein
MSAPLQATTSESVGEEGPFTWTRAAAASTYQAPEAFLVILSLAAAIDGRMRPLESLLLQDVTRRWWERGVLREKDVEALNSAVCARLGAGTEAALAAAGTTLPRRCRKAAFAQALDLMLWDGPLNGAEQTLAALIARTLGIEESEARRTIDMLTEKNEF